MKKDNIVLIGMPGVGKSTAGVILAKVLGYEFVDADLVIQKEEGKLLKEIIEEVGTDGFIAVENRVNSSLEVDHSIIATGGSVVYGKEAMEHLKSIGTVVYLQLPFEELNRRLSDIKGRGVVLKDGQTLKDLYEERVPLYEKYADITVNEYGLNVEQTIDKILSSRNEKKCKKIELTKKVIIELFVIAGLFLVLLFFAVSQKVTIGQKYQQVYFNGELVGNIAGHVSVDDAVHEVRRELAAESDEPLCMDYEYSSSKANDWFTPLMTEDALKEALKEKMKVSEIETQVRAYTVAIEGYRGNFKSMDEVTEFLNTVKNEADTEGQYTTQISKEAGHISGIYTAQLTEVDPKENTEVTPEVTLADQVSAGANGAFTYQMEYAMANPRDDSYETGTIGMEFIERVEVYEKYISGDALSDVETQVEEVTKEKETNKIYVVESGDVLSVIAMDHDTTVANIMALNGFDNAEVRIYPGQEIIIAVPEPDLSLRIKKGEVYEEDYNAEPTIIKNDEWYTTKQVVHQEGTTGHRERNDIVTYENGIEVARELAHQTIMVESTPAIIEQGTITPPTYIKPLAGGHFTSGFGRRWGRMHKGVDWGCPVGTTVYASSAGTVVSAGYSKGYGNNVVISHPDGRMTRYAHNSKLLVSAGQWVEQGQSIALSGSTGRSTGPHVHFEIYINGVAVNPLNYIGQ